MQQPKARKASTEHAAAADTEKFFPHTIEVALSGGGLRATVFSLGALLYLVHAGLNTRVRNIC